MTDRHLDPLELDAARAGEPFEHLETCEACRTEVEALASLAGRLRPVEIDVPEERDRAILALAARRLGRRRPVWAYAAAAAVLVAAGLGIFLGAGRDPMDIDGNGTVDMVDAYMLARQRGDAAEIEGIARRSVELR